MGTRFTAGWFVSRVPGGGTTSHQELEMSQRILRGLARGDFGGQVSLEFAEPTTINVRSNFSAPRTRQETVVSLSGHVCGGWGDTFLLNREDGPDGFEVWDVRLDYSPTVVSFVESD